MKIKKLIIIILFLLILTGCTTKVNLEISDNIVYEQIIIDDQTTPKTSFRNYIPVFNKDEIVDTHPDISEPNISYYKKETKDNKIYYSYAYRLNEYNNSKTMKNFFSSSAIVSSERTGIMELYTSSDGIYVFDKYPSLSRLEINIKTALEVEESNADNVSGNTYTWVFTPSNKNKSIYLRMRNYHYKQKHPDEYKEKKNNDNNNNNENNNNENNNTGEKIDSNDGYNGGIKANIKYKNQSTEEEKKEESNKLLFAVILVVGFLFALIIIAIISNKKNR